jgi:hypothetical protein
MTLAWYFEDEETAASIAVLDRVVEESAVVPALWRLEVLNGLQVAVRRGRISLAYRDASLNDLRSLVRLTPVRRGLSRIGTAPPASARDA